MSLSAAVDGSGGKSIELVQHTPKRDRGPQLQVSIKKVSPTPPGKIHAGSDHHGYSITSFHPGGVAPAQTSPYLPLQNNADDGSSTPLQSSYTSPSPAVLTSSMNTHYTFERIQFKSATANNGKRRAAQQYYHLIVELWADVRGPCETGANWVKVAQRASESVVVRGRSPSHYQNEGTHPGSSSAGRGGSSQAGSGASGYGASGYGGSRGLGSSGLSGLSSGGSPSSGGYRSVQQYSLEPSPETSHPISSASSSSDGPMDLDHPLASRGPMMSESEAEGVDQYRGYQYYPRVAYDGLPPIMKAEATSSLFDEPLEPRRYPVREESATHVQGVPLHLTGCGRFQGYTTSRGLFFPDLNAGY
ncbi:hypothetical protein B0A49_10333 [Cryomyces minteri]|uniref:NDT80 domain-containing protein n=1 Tax=Cryomyces minteri TaxID=331657 RepID=A0A4V6WKY6_9PEZI|nr:hypothetical protein B0A49_10333 [Cryomyces minteri]